MCWLSVLCTQVENECQLHLIEICFNETQKRIRKEIVMTGQTLNLLALCWLLVLAMFIGAVWFERKRSMRNGDQPQ